jgi:hypothetical protein
MITIKLIDVFIIIEYLKVNLYSINEFNEYKVLKYFNDQY